MKKNEKGYIEESLAEVEKYLDEVNNKNQLNEEFEKYYLEKRQDIKNDVIKTDWYKELSQKVKDILDGSKFYNYEKKSIDESVTWKAEEKKSTYTIGYKGSFSIQFPAILTQLCKIYEVKIEDKICNKLGSNLGRTFEISAEAKIDDEILTVEENTKMELKWKKQDNLKNELEKACQDLLTTLRKKIMEEHKDKFNFFESLPNNAKSWKWDDEAVYDLVSKLDEFKLQSRKMLLDEFKKNNEAGDFDAKIVKPEPQLFNLLEDANLKTCYLKMQI